MRLRIPIINLLKDAQQTFLVGDFSAGSATLTVQNTYGFTTNQVLFIGQIGNESSEILFTSSSTAPANEVITLAATTSQSHANNDTVREMLYDSVEISTATTLTGTKTVLNTIYLDVSNETIYDDSTVTTGYYFIRYKNSVTSVYSTYSDGIPVTDYPMNSARYLIDSALAEINRPPSDTLSDDFFFKQINNAQMEVLRELKRWSWMAKFNSPFTQAQVGTWKYAMPSDIDDVNTNKSIYNLKMGQSGNLVWCDKEQWNNLTSQVYYGTLANTLNIGDGTVTLVSSNDFPTSGTISIGNDQLTYTANNTTTDVLTLASNSTVTHPIGNDVFMSQTTGTPMYYTTFNGYIYVWPVVDSTNDQENFYADYYTTLVPITTDSQTIVVPDPILIKTYLVWKALVKINNGQDDEGSKSHQQNFMDKLKKLKQTEVMGRRIRLVPRYNDYGQLMSMDGDSKFTRTQGFWPNNF